MNIDTIEPQRISLRKSQGERGFASLDDYVIDLQKSNFDIKLTFLVHLFLSIFYFGMSNNTYPVHKINE